MTTFSSPLTTTGWRNRRTWTYLWALVCSAIALGISFIVSAETLRIARYPESKLSCDINATVSCTTVAQSWQAELIHFGSLSIPNAYLGIAVESVFVTIAVVALTGTQLPKWFNRATWLGSLAALLYAYWLFSQSLFSIKALCVWCLGLMFTTTVQFMSFSHATVTVENLPSPSGPFASLNPLLRTYYQRHFDLMVDIVWIAILCAIIIVVDGPALF